MKQELLGAICLTLAASIWGGMYVVSKYVLNFVPPLTLVWLRYIVAFVVLFIVLKRVEAKNKKEVARSKGLAAPCLDWFYRIFSVHFLSVFGHEAV